MLLRKLKACTCSLTAIPGVLLGLLLPLELAALGLGDLSSTSLLGEPLQAEIQTVDPQREYRAEDLVVRKVEAARAEQLGFEAISANYGLLLGLENTPNGVVVRVASRRPVLEPFVNFHVELQWPKGSVIREYTLFLDPPAVVVAAASAPQRAEVNTAAGQPPKAPLPPARQAAVAAVIAGSEYQVRSGDNLSAIAGRWSRERGENRTTLVQWLLQNNPQAFIGGDIDRLKAGATLRLPTDADLPLRLNTNAAAPTSRAPQLPVREVDAESRAASANAVAATESSNNSQAWMDNLPTRQQEATSTEREPQAGQQAAKPAAGMLRLSTKDGYAEAPSFAELDAESPQSLKAYLDTARETIDRVQRDNADLRRQIEAIENSEYINSLRELIELQTRQLDQLKRQRVASGSPLAAATAPQAQAALLEVDAVTPLAEQPLENRAAYKWWVALGMLILALILIGLIIRRLWEQQQERYKTHKLPVKVAPIKVAAVKDTGVKAVTPAKVTAVAAAAGIASSIGDGMQSVRPAVKAPQKDQGIGLSEHDFEISDEDLKDLGSLDLDIEAVDFLPLAESEPVTNSPFEDVVPEVPVASAIDPAMDVTLDDSSMEDDWDELFDAIISKESLSGNKPTSFELDLDFDGIAAEPESAPGEKAAAEKKPKAK